MIEITVILKDSERTYRQKFLQHSRLDLWGDSKDILDCIKEARNNFHGEPEDIEVRASLVVK